MGDQNQSRQVTRSCGHIGLKHAAQCGAECAPLVPVLRHVLADFMPVCEVPSLRHTATDSWNAYPAPPLSSTTRVVVIFMRRVVVRFCVTVECCKIKKILDVYVCSRTHNKHLQGSHARQTMTMTMTLKEVQPTLVRGLAYRRECRGHNPAKKSLLELVWLALLARFALAHS